MGTTLAPRDLELYQRTDEILHYLWDPCSASDAPQARDEYYAYLPVVFSLLKRDAAPNEIAEYLRGVEIQRTGFAGDNINGTLRIAKILVAWRDQIAGAIV